MYLKELASMLAISITFIAFLPYLRGIATNSIKPHFFSWVIWGITTTVVFFAQLQDEGGVGAWPTGVSGCLTISIAVLAFVKRADINISLLDWGFLLAALTSLPVWFLTTDPMLAVVMLTIVDVLGFGPTARKVWHAPWTESPVFYSLYVSSNLLVLVALENYSVTTALFPIAIALGCMVVIVLVWMRRRIVPKPA